MDEIANWRNILKNNFTDWEKLASFLELNEEQKKEILKKPKFVLNLPVRLATKIKKGTLDDPILKQFLPIVDETKHTEAFSQDPTQDKAFRKSSKLLQKYDGRALVVTTSACAMHCRFCFRQNFPYETERRNFDEEVASILSDTSIKEVILSGGDPLSLSNRILKDFLDKLSVISHVKRIRFHSRFPIGIPERIDEEFVAIVKSFSKQIYFVLHCNHPLELDEDVIHHLHHLRNVGVVLLNQSVLLKGVNDQVGVLKTLSEKLADSGIVPYYLHQLDQVQGMKHFEVEEEKGLQLVNQLTESLSGYAVPKYVKEIPQQKSKTNLHSFHGLDT